jgi:peptidoglycan/LPS O-acetylase OafA/YrhL
MEFKNSIFDSLKGFAISIIFIMHVYHFVPFGGFFSNFILMGTIGVQMFFIISGYLLASNYPSFDNFKSIFFFYLRRLKRIYPIFVFFTFVNLFFLVFMKGCIAMAI